MSSPLVLVPSSCKLAVDSHLHLDVHTTQAARRTHDSLSRKVESTRNGFASPASTALRQQPPPRLPGRHHPGRTQDHSGSRERKAALTLGPVGGEFGADFCRLGKMTYRSNEKHSRISILEAMRGFDVRVFSQSQVYLHISLQANGKMEWMLCWVNR